MTCGQEGKGKMGANIDKVRGAAVATQQRVLSFPDHAKPAIETESN